MPPAPWPTCGHSVHARQPASPTPTAPVAAAIPVATPNIARRGAAAMVALLAPKCMGQQTVQNAGCQRHKHLRQSRAKADTF